MHSESKLDANLTRAGLSLVCAPRHCEHLIQAVGLGIGSHKTATGLFFAKNVTISLFRASDAESAPIHRAPGSDMSGQNSRTGEHNARKPRPGVGL